MKTIVCMLAALSFAAAAENKPDFSGEWKMNFGKSALGPIPAPTSLVRRIIHSDPTLTITEEQKGGSGDHVTTREYTTDGREVTFQENGATVKATAMWDGESLVIHSNADAGGFVVVFTEKMTLSDGNKVLSNALHVASPQGEIDAIYSFDRQ
jgi:hypothetical protein